MGNDYHIYIHSNNGGGGFGEQTKPFESRKENKAETESKDGEEESAAAAISPYVAIAIAVWKGVEKVTKTTSSFAETYLGNYAYAMGVNNFYTMVGNVLNPVGWAKNEITFRLNIDKENKRVEQTRKLIGLASSTRIKEGV